MGTRLRPPLEGHPRPATGLHLARTADTPSGSGASKVVGRQAVLTALSCALVACLVACRE